MKHTAGRYVRLLGFAFANLLVMSACDPAAVKLRQFAVQGERLYIENCSNCHQADGSGLALLYPPLKGTGAAANPQRIACIIRNGISGPLNVNGRTYDQPMRGIPLTDLEIAEIITYITAEWSDSGRLIEAESVSNWIRGCQIPSDTTQTSRNN